MQVPEGLLLQLRKQIRCHATGAAISRTVSLTWIPLLSCLNWYNRNRMRSLLILDRDADASAARLQCSTQV